MNETHKMVLQRHQRELADDIIISEEFFGLLYHRKVFERNMIEIIRAEKTPTDQVYKLLSLLPRRGPEAFEAFVDILKVDYPWLATTLDSSYRATVESLSRQNSFSNLQQILPMCSCGGVKADNQAEVAATPRPSVDFTADQDIKAKVGTFIHKTFGHSKRVSQQDKKMMEKWFSEQIQLERKRLKKIESTSSEEMYSESNERGAYNTQMTAEAQENLKRTYEKVRDENMGDLVNNNQTGEGPEDCDEMDGAGPKKPEDLQSLIANLEAEVDKLINKLSAQDTLMDQCHYIVGDPDRKHNLANLVKDLQIEMKGYERELNKEKEKAEKMLTELYDYCKAISKMENQRNQQRHQMKALEEENNKLKTENIILLDKCKALEAANLQHVEKEKTLENLRKMVVNLQTSHGNLVDENSNYRNNYGAYGTTTRGYRRTGARAQSRRGSVLETSTNNGNNKKSVTKPSLAVSNARRKPLTRS